jgi:hypothetical protein
MFDPALLANRSILADTPARVDRVIPHVGAQFRAIYSIGGSSAPSGVGVSPRRVSIGFLERCGVGVRVPVRIVDAGRAREMLAHLAFSRGKQQTGLNTLGNLVPLVQGLDVDGSDPEAPLG